MREVEIMPNFTEKELHCIARLLQSACFGGNGNVFDGCDFCKYQCHNEQQLVPQYNVIMKKLEQITGVDLSPMSNKMVRSNFPYKKFLHNANEKIKNYFRDYFKNV